MRLPLSAPRLTRSPRGAGRTVILHPGYGTNDAALTPLRSFLRCRGHSPTGWLIGKNRGEVEQMVERRLPLTRIAAEESGRPVNLVGWSLGGVVAREVAREAPDVVNHVITIATPLHGPRYTASAAAFDDERTAAIEAIIAARRDWPITVPVTAVYSRLDGIVDWRSCIDNETADVEHVEVSSSHVGATVDPEVWGVIADRLAE